VHLLLYAAFWVLLLGLVLAAGAVAAARLPVTLAPHGPPLAQRSLWVLFAVTLTVLVGKLALLHRFAAVVRSKAYVHNLSLDALLPFQERDLRELVETIFASPLDYVVRAAPLQGVPGDQADEQQRRGQRRCP
jgi:hypothetical protein